MRRRTSAGTRVADRVGRSENAPRGGASGLKTVEGIADIGFARAAWIVDPHGNVPGILELK